jgi:hypothetical protein
MSARIWPVPFALAALFAGCEPAKDAPKAAPKAVAKAVAAVRLAPARNTWTDEQFENWVFQNQGSAATARAGLNGQVQLVIEEIDRACTLTDAQRAKLRLAGRGDVKRLFDRFERARDKFRALGNAQDRLQEVMPDVTAVQRAVTAGPLSPDLLVIKSLRTTLTPEQFARYDAVARERREARHRANVQRVVSIFEQSVPMPEARRRELLALLARETRPIRQPHQYEFYILLAQVARIPEEKLKPFFSAPQWKVVRQQLDRGRQIEQALKQQGQGDDGGDAADGPAGR